MTRQEEQAIDLSGDEWLLIINKEADGLPMCCANISDLRDHIINLAREGCKLPYWSHMALLRSYRVALDSHPELEELAALQKLMTQVQAYYNIWVKDLKHEGNGE